MSKIQIRCKAQLRSGDPCKNRAQPKYDSLWCGIHARSKGYVSIEDSQRRIEFSNQPIACSVEFMECGRVKLDALTLESMQIYQHQFETATRVVDHLQNGDQHILVVAEPQLGKTGTIQTICWMATRLSRNINPIICLPMNDNDLARQIAKDYRGLVSSTNIINAQRLRDHLYLSKILDRNPNAINWLIIDESHLGTTFTGASRENMLYRELATIGVDLNLVTVPTNVRIITVSATPMAESAALLETKRQIIMSKPINYWGIGEMHSAGHLIQTGPLRDEKWATHFLETLPKDRSGYIIVRVSNNNATSFTTRIAEYYDQHHVNYQITDCHHKRNKTIDFNELIKHSLSTSTCTSTPDATVHHFLLVYGRLRASKRLIYKENILAIHDYSKGCDTTVQGLLGRLCGYQVPTAPVLGFVNLQVVLPYLHWIKRDFSPQSVPDKSKNIKGGVTYQMLRKCTRGYFPVMPLVIYLEDSHLLFFRELADEFQKQGNAFYHSVADRVLDRLAELSASQIKRIINTSSKGTEIQTSNLLVRKGEEPHVEYVVRSGNSMMFLTESNSSKTVKQFEQRYHNSELGVPVMPFTMSSLEPTRENHYFLYINLLETEIIRPCLWLGLVEYRDSALPICDHIEVKPESLYYISPDGEKSHQLQASSSV